MKINWKEKAATNRGTGFGYNQGVGGDGEVGESYCQYQITIEGRYKCVDAPEEEPESGGAVGDREYAGTASRETVPKLQVCYQVTQTCHCQSFSLGLPGEEGDTDEQRKERQRRTELNIGACNHEGERKFFFRETMLQDNCTSRTQISTRGGGSGGFLGTSGESSGTASGSYGGGGGDDDSASMARKCSLRSKQQYFHEGPLREVYGSRGAYNSANSPQLGPWVPLHPGEEELAKKCGIPTRMDRVPYWDAGAPQPPEELFWGDDEDWDYRDLTEEQIMCLSRSLCPTCPGGDPQDLRGAMSRMLGAGHHGGHYSTIMLEYIPYQCGHGDVTEREVEEGEHKDECDPTRLY